MNLTELKMMQAFSLSLATRKRVVQWKARGPKRSRPQRGQSKFLLGCTELQVKVGRPMGRSGASEHLGLRTRTKRLVLGREDSGGLGKEVTEGAVKISGTSWGEGIEQRRGTLRSEPWGKVTSGKEGKEELMKERKESGHLHRNILTIL